MVYDALYSWCRYVRGETHSWNPQRDPRAGLMGTLLLSRSEVERLLPLADCIEAVRGWFPCVGSTGRSLGPVVSALHAPAGGFHFKAAGMGGYIAGKLNANFPGNPARGRPTIQGLVLLCDAEQGEPLGVFDSTAITALRTAAATAVAARFLAREDARVATIVGCGAQGRRADPGAQPGAAARASLRLRSRPSAARNKFAADMGVELGIEVSATTDLRTCPAVSQICITCTPSKTSADSTGRRQCRDLHRRGGRRQR